MFSPLGLPLYFGPSGFLFSFFPFYFDRFLLFFLFYFDCFGWFNLIAYNKDSKIITDFSVTSANVHDSQCMEELIDENDKEVWLDSAYTGEELEEVIRKKNAEIILHINEKGKKNQPLTGEQKASNREKSKTRSRVEHVNGQMTVCGGLFIRCIGIWRAETAILLKNMAYNISRFAYLTVKKPLTA